MTRFMEAVIALAILVVAGIILCGPARADVVIEVKQEPIPIACPLPAPAVVRNEDGTYTRENVVSMTLQMCFIEPEQRLELWSDYPERGGSFLKPLPRDARDVLLIVPQ